MSELRGSILFRFSSSAQEHHVIRGRAMGEGLLRTYLVVIQEVLCLFADALCAVVG